MASRPSGSAATGFATRALWANASTTDGAAVVQWADNGTNDHLWSFYKLSDGHYALKNLNSNLYLQSDASGNLTQTARSASTAQEWTITVTSDLAYPLPLGVAGTGTAVHDPNMIEDSSGTFWLYGTHNTLASSTDMVNFTALSTGDISPDFSWWASKNTTGTNGRTDIWAPSVMYANGKYYQYYSIPIYDTPSKAGTNQGAEAVIALATATSPNGPWTDAGQIIASCGTTSGCATTFNAIDPAPYIDASGKRWLTFGSWEDGAHVLQARAYDLAGNVGHSAPVSVTVTGGNGGGTPVTQVFDNEDANDGYVKANASGGSAGFFNQFVGLHVGVGNNLLRFCLGVGEFLAGFFRVFERLGNLLFAVLKHFEQRLVSEFREHHGNDHEQRELREKQARLPAELAGHGRQRIFFSRSSNS